MSVSGYTLMCGETCSMSKSALMCLSGRDFWEKIGQDTESVSVLSVSCCLFLSGRRSDQSQRSLSVLERLFWITARDLSAAGKPRAIWGSWVWLGIPPQTYCPSLGSDPGAGTCLYMCSIPPQSHSHTDPFTPPWKWPKPRRQTSLTRGRITLSSHVVISIVSHGIVLQPLFHAI